MESNSLQWNPSNTDTLGPLKCVLIRGVSSFQGANNTYLYEVGTWSSVLIREVSSFQGCPLRGVPLHLDCGYNLTSFLSQSSVALSRTFWVERKREFSDTNFEIRKPCWHFDWMLQFHRGETSARFPGLNLMLVSENSPIFTWISETWQ